MAQASTALLSPSPVSGREIGPSGARRGRPRLSDELALDLAMHRSEEQEQARNMRPLLDRLYLYAVDSGPAAFQTVAAVERWHKRHAARWADSE